MKLSNRNSARWAASASGLALVGLAVSMVPAANAASGGRAQEQGQQLAYETVESYSQGYLMSANEFAVSSLAEWQQVMSGLANDLLIAPAPTPNVGTWENCLVVMISTGDRSNYKSLEVSSVRLHGNQLLVDVTVVPAGASGMMYSPYAVVRVELGTRSSKSLKSLQLSVRYNCNVCVPTDLGTQTASLDPGLAGHVEDSPAEQQKSWGDLKGMYR